MFPVFKCLYARIRAYITLYVHSVLCDMHLETFNICFYTLTPKMAIFCK
jgi:hypothetical protein